MLQKLNNLKEAVQEWRLKRAVLMITVNVKEGVMLASYKGKTMKGYFEDETARHVMKGIRLDKNMPQFLNALGKIINEVRE